MCFICKSSNIAPATSLKLGEEARVIFFSIPSFINSSKIFSFFQGVIVYLSLPKRLAFLLIVISFNSIQKALFIASTIG